MQAEKQFTVLFLDDEANILRAMKRLFHGRHHRLVLVDDGSKALEFMKDNAVHVVVSDMKMPAMAGESFLSKVAQNFPKTYRIVLSGFAEIDSLMVAINQGRIHRFLQKPWNNEALIEAIEEGIDTFKLKHENESLQTKLQSQNKRLALLNSSLEERVELRTLQIKTAMKRADMNVAETKKVLFNTVGSVPHIQGKVGKEVSKIANKIAQAMQLETAEIDNITYAGLINEIGMIGLTPEIYTTPYTKMSPKQQDAFNNQGNQVMLMLSPANQLKRISDILVNQFEAVNGSGYPNGLKKADIPIGAQVIAVARDYYRYLTGKHDGEKYKNNVVIGKLNNFAGILYSKAVLSALESVMLVSDQGVEKDGLKTSELTPGMKLLDSIYNNKDILIMPQGQVLDASAITKLKELEERFDFTLTIFAK